MSAELIEKLKKTLFKIYNQDFVNVLSAFLSGEQAVLFSLYTNKTQTSTNMTENTHISKSRMSAIIKSLLKKGLIVLKSDSNDKRKKNIIITEKGETQILVKMREADDILENVSNKMGEEKTMALICILDYMVEKNNE